jgi:DNA-binding response OmpR family regulator
MPSDYVLIVEDDIDLAETLAEILVNAGHAVKIAANGREALLEVEQGMPALILLDLFMPIMDGRAFASELVARYGQHAPVILMTAAEEARACAADIGAIDLLGKPFDVRKLIALARQHVPRAPTPGANTAP